MQKYIFSDSSIKILETWMVRRVASFSWKYLLHAYAIYNTFVPKYDVFEPILSLLCQQQNFLKLGLKLSYDY